jgi:hypothetical protein
MKVSIFIISIFLLFSCSKQSEKKLVGTWIVERVEIKDGAGFVYYDTLFESNSNAVTFSQDSLNAFVCFQFTPLASNFEVSDSLIINCKWSKSNDLIALSNKNYSLKLELLSKNQLVFNYYDYSKYRLKTFFMRKN